MDGGTEVYGTLVSDIQTDVSVTGKPVYLTASGNDITVDVKKGNMTNPVVTMKPIQNLNGYDNAWVGGAGKNKFDTPNATSTGAKNIFLNKTLVLTAGTYTLNFSSEERTNDMTISFKNDETNVLTINVASNENNKTFVLTEDSDNLTWYVREAVDLSNIQIESGNQATSYAPYENICPIYPRTKTEISVNGSVITREYGQEIYGGTDEIAEGVLTDEYAFHILNGTEEWEHYSVAQGNMFRIKLTDRNNSVEVYELETKCNKYKVTSNASRTNGSVSGARNTQYFDFIDDRFANQNEWKAYLATSPIQIAYKKQTPQEILTTKGYVPLDKGTNEITVSNNDIITFDYCSTLAGKISGTLSYIEDGLAPSGYLSGSGNFLALHLDSEDWDIYTSVKVGLYPSEGSGMVEILTDEEKICVGKITSNDQVFMIESTDGTLTKTDVYSLSDLILETE